MLLRVLFTNRAKHKDLTFSVVWFYNPVDVHLTQFVHPSAASILLFPMFTMLATLEIDPIYIYKNLFTIINLYYQQV